MLYNNEAMKGILVFLIITFLHTFSLAQGDNNQGLKSELLFNADVMINATEASSRIRAATTFNDLFEQYLSKNTIFQDSAAFFKYISILDSPKNEFKLITWLIKGDREYYDFKGYVVRPNGNITPLIKTELVSEDLEYSQSNHENWYGCLYYKMIPNKDTGGYILFGYDPNGLYDNQKIVDHMLVSSNSINFGAEIFEDKENLDTYKNRLVLRYSSDASVTVNYNLDMKMIVHDHLSQVMGFQPGQGPTAIPDGTYEGYYFKKGKWKYKEKLFNHIYDEAPRPQPVFKDTEDKSK